MIIYNEKKIAEAAANGHFEGAHQKRNCDMVNRSDLIVFCIQREIGSAWKTMRYTKKQNIAYIKLTCNIKGIV